MSRLLLPPVTDARSSRSCSSKATNKLFRGVAVSRGSSDMLGATKVEGGVKAAYLARRLRGDRSVVRGKRSIDFGGHYGQEVSNDSVHLPDINCPEGTRKVKGEWVRGQLKFFESHLSYALLDRSNIKGIPVLPVSPELSVTIFQLMLLKDTSLVRELQKKSINDLLPTAHIWMNGYEKLGRQAFAGFVKFAVKGRGCDDRTVEKLFKLFDKDCNGEITVKELISGLGIVGKDASPGQVLYYFFSFLSESGSIPRYTTKFEVETLLSSYDTCIDNASPPAAAQHRPIHTLLASLISALTFDGLGRAPLSALLASISSYPALTEILFENPLKNYKDPYSGSYIPLPSTDG